MMNTKLILLTILGGMTILLGICTVALTTILTQKKNQMHQKQKQKQNQDNMPSTKKETSTTLSELQISLFEPERDLQKHRQYAPDPASARGKADAHFHESIQLFEETETYPLGDAGYDIYSNYGISMKINHNSKGKYSNGIKRGDGELKRVSTESVFNPYSSLSFLNGISNVLFDRLFRRKQKIKNSSSSQNLSNEPSPNLTSSSSYIGPYEAYVHLEKSAKNGNPEAQHLLANLLASSVFLPKRNGSKDDSNSIPLDFGSSPPLTLVLWHYAAISGHLESQLAMGYRHYQTYQNKNDNILFNQMTGNNLNDPSAFNGALRGEYGLEHTSCETALAYYEEAAHAMMDELERGIWRGKVKPADDRHMLAEMHFLGGSNILLQGDNKPDELEEALEYYRIRALSSQTNPFAAPAPPDIHAAFTLATFHHHGLRGVPQDLSLALQYYEIAADGGSREAAGLAGKFHLLGIGYEGDEMSYFNQFGFNPSFPKYEFLGDTDNALKYLKMGAPGGVHNCNVKAPNTSSCDPEAMNGLGLAYLIGVPGKIPRDIIIAKTYFQLARDKGSMDATFHLAMMRFGWWESSTFPPKKKKNEKAQHKDENVTPSKSSSNEKGNEQKSTKSASIFFPGEDNYPVNSHFIEQTAMYALAGTGSDLETRKKNVQMGISDLSKAANKRHIQALHRLGTFYSHGIPLNPGNYEESEEKKNWILEPKCKNALNMFKLLLDGAPISSKRTRRAYKQYVAGNVSGSLKNYMAAAETGNVVGMMNSAWLLERQCPLSEKEQWKCNRASLRYWTEAGRLGNAEAILNIGDFYYYNRFESISESIVEMPLEGQAWIIGNLQTVFDYVLYPEKLWKDGKAWLIRMTKQFVLQRKRKKSRTTTRTDVTTCIAEDDQICAAPFIDEQKFGNSAPFKNTAEDSNYSHFKIAASYYKKAAKDHNSARANFNLGFMHQWGIGLTQDFPLAKRHYDLAKSMNPIAIQLALYGMRWHEKVVRWHWSSTEQDKNKNGALNAIFSHFLCLETGVIMGLIMVLTRMLQKRRNRVIQNTN